MTEHTDRYKAAMLLSGVGDSLGYKNQAWEYCESGPQIHTELAELGGVDNITTELPGWPVSDDTVMHLATAEGLTSGKTSTEDILVQVSKNYIECMKDMEGRKPGPTSIKGCEQMDPSKPGGYHIPFNPTGTGCGAAMRSMCIGLAFPSEKDIESLVLYGVETGRMTHHHPTGYLGSLASAVLTSCAIQQKPVVSWGRYLLEILPKAKEYVEKTGIAVEENLKAWDYFQEKWQWYLNERGISDGKSSSKFPEKYNVEDRDIVYKTFSLDGWAGRSGHDAPMIAYDSLLASGSNWKELCSRSMFHAGDSDSTGVIAAACFGAMYGLEKTPSCNYEKLEYGDRLKCQGELLYKLSYP